MSVRCWCFRHIVGPTSNITAFVLKSRLHSTQRLEVAAIHKVRYLYSLLLPPRWRSCDQASLSLILSVTQSISNNRTGFDRPSDRPYLVQPARSTPSPLTRLPSGVLCFVGETGEWGRGADTAVYPTTAATHHSNLKQLMIPYQLLQQHAGQRDVVRRCNMWIL